MDCGMDPLLEHMLKTPRPFIAMGNIDEAVLVNLII